MCASPPQGPCEFKELKPLTFKPDFIFVFNPLKEKKNMVISTFSVTWLKDPVNTSEHREAISVSRTPIN